MKCAHVSRNDRIYHETYCCFINNADFSRTSVNGSLIFPSGPPLLLPSQTGKGCCMLSTLRRVVCTITWGRALPRGAFQQEGKQCLLPRRALHDSSCLWRRFNVESTARHGSTRRRKDTKSLAKRHASQTRWALLAEAPNRRQVSPVAPAPARAT